MITFQRAIHVSRSTCWPPDRRGRSRRGTASKIVPCACDRVSTAEAAIDAAVAGAGLTHVLSYQVARLVRQGKLRIESNPIRFPVSLLHAGQGLLPLKLRRFLEFAGTPAATIPCRRSERARSDIQR
jgi:DNA-binding transcriptional LysR family regulator